MNPNALSDTPAAPSRIPSYRRHKPSGQAVATFGGRDFYLGAFGSTASKREYRRRLAGWWAPGAPFGDAFAQQMVALLGGRAPLMLDSMLPELKLAQRPHLARLIAARADVEAAYQRALEAGAESVQAPTKKEDEDKRGGIKDAGGTTWWIATKVE